MAECIIARGGGRSDGGSSGPPIIPGMHTILTTVTDSAGVPIQDLSVHCKDGATWYNYHTNEKGQVLFATNSGAANITAWNFSLNGNYKYLDQETITKDLDAPIGTSTQLNLQLPFQSEISYQSTGTNLYKNILFSGNCKVRVANYVNVFLGGAGGGGGGGYEIKNKWFNAEGQNRFGYNLNFAGGSGAGGGITIQNQIKINHNECYKFYIGTGGAGGKVNNAASNGSSGGSTTAFGFTSTGGGGGVSGYYTYSDNKTSYRASAGTGTYKGGNGGQKRLQPGNSGFNNWGGGGAVHESALYDGEPFSGRWYTIYNILWAGKPYGSNNVYGMPTTANNGGGGSSLSSYNGGKGGPGKISFTFY